MIPSFKTSLRLRALRYGETSPPPVFLYGATSLLCDSRRLATSLRAMLLLAVTLLPGTALADWLVMPQVGIKFGTSTTLTDPEIATGEVKVVYGATVAWLGEGVVGFETDLGYTPGFFNTGGGCVRPPCATLVNSSYVTTLVSNVVLTVPRRLTEYSLRPYISSGMGWMRVKADVVEPLPPIDVDALGFNVGGGAIGFFSPRTGIRWDLRYFRNLTSPETAPTIANERMHLGFWRAAVAIVFR